MVIVSILFLLVALVCVLLRKAYDIAPDYELKRQAVQGNELARQLFRAVAYGRSLHILLWLGQLIGTTVGLALLVTSLSLWQSIPIIAVYLWLAFDWLPKIRIGRTSMFIARRLTPVVVWKLHYLDAPFKLLARWFDKHVQPRHSGLYELQDFLDLLNLQSQQTDSRITTEEIELIRNVIGFGDQRVGDVMRPRKGIKTVSVGDAIGPVLLDELHASGQTVFPVKKSARSKEIVASLHLGDIGIHSTGSVQDYATQGANYINESDTLADALHAFFQTKQQLFIVIDNEQEYLGVITLEDILHTLVGRPAADEQLGSHDDAMIVSSRHDDISSPKTADHKV